MRKAGLPLQRLLGGEALSTLAKDLRYADVTALYAAVGENHISATSVVEKLMTALGGAEGAVEDIAETAIPTRRSTPRRAGQRRPRRRRPRHVRRLGEARQVLHAGARRRHPRLRHPRRRRQRAPHRLHQRRGPAAQARAAGRGRVGQPPGSVFLVAIQVEALDRHRLLSDVTKALADERVNILSASVQTSRDRVAVSRFTFELADPAHLGAVLQTVRNVEGVFDVERVTA